ncbi:hypothetical protein GGP77_002555 [Salinibacter ruber]|nr:hypothetical protein [Salinibacter ruber]
MFTGQNLPDRRVPPLLVVADEPLVEDGSPCRDSTTSDSITSDSITSDSITSDSITSERGRAHRAYFLSIATTDSDHCLCFVGAEITEWVDTKCG